MKLLVNKELETEQGTYTLTGNGPYQLNKDGIKVCQVSKTASTAVQQVLNALAGVKVKDSLTPQEEKEFDKYYNARLSWGKQKQFPEKAAGLNEEQIKAIKKRFDASLVGKEGHLPFIVVFDHTPSIYALEQVFSENPVDWYESAVVGNTWVVVGEAMQ